jgi:hypothetical protein
MSTPTVTSSSQLFQSNSGILLATLLVQLSLLAVTFPLPGWEQGQGLFHIDHPFHIYQVTLGRALLDHGNLVGYDPFFGGGNLGGVTFNASAKLPVLISLLVPDSVSTETLYLFYVFLCALIAPLAIASVGMILRWPAIQTAVAALIGILFWWIGAFRWYHTAGMVSFVCACYTSIVYSVWAYQLIRARDNKFPYAKIAAAGILGGLGLWLHPLFGVMAGAMITAFGLVNFRDLNLRSAIATAIAIGLIALALNAPWIVVMRTGSNILDDNPYQKDFGIEFLANAMIGVWGRSMGSLLNPFVVALGLIAMFLGRSERRREIIAFFSTGSTLILFAAFGAKVSMLANLQPNRFLAPGFLLIGIAASYAIADGKTWLQVKQQKILSMMSMASLVLLAAILARELVREVIPGTHGRYGMPPPEVTYPPGSVSWLDSWINEHTNPEGRILFETSLARKHGGGHIAGYLTLRTKREFIGAPYPFLMPERSFWDKAGFGRPLAELTTKQLVAGLDLYNVGWVIAHSEELSQRVAELPQARLLAQRDGIHIFGINRPLSYFEVGDAHVVERNFDRLEISAKPGDKLILRYHWLKGISTTPKSQIEPISLSPDLPPFIQITNAPVHFRIHLN